MLTPKQKEVIKIFWKRGSFLAEDLYAIYTTTESKRDCINKLLTLGIISIDGSRLKINREKYLEYEEMSNL